MSVNAYNKVSRVWTTTVDGTDLPDPQENWVIDPVFQDKEFAMRIGQKFWTFNGNTINTPTQQEYATILLTEARNNTWLGIQAERERRKSNGVKVGNNWFHSDDTSRIQQLGLVMFGANMPPGIMWKTLSGNFVEMTPTLALQIFQSVAVNDMTIFGTAEYHRANMMVSNDPANYNYLVGWPPTFGE